jgi:hypothetical protein
MVKRRRTGTRSLARGIFAFFWIVLAGASGLYLFTLFTNPAALGGQAVQVSAVTGEEMATGAAAAPVPMPAASSGDSAEVTKLKGTIQALSQQVAQLNARLKPIEKFIGPVAALPPAASVTTSPPKPPAPAQAEPAAASEPAQEPEAAVEDVTVEENVVEAEPPAPTPAPRAEPAPPPPAAEATPEPAAAEPPAVAEAPMEDDQGEPENNAAPNTPAATPAAPAAPSQEVDIAAYDPVELPPAANDGSTRYGIEIGTVAKRDELRPLWREFLTKHAALVAGLQPRCVLAPDKKWRLVAGPFSNAQDAEGACSLFKKADRPCSATVYAGDAL